MWSKSTILYFADNNQVNPTVSESFNMSAINTQIVKSISAYFASAEAHSMLFTIVSSSITSAMLPFVKEINQLKIDNAKTQSQVNNLTEKVAKLEHQAEGDDQLRCKNNVVMSTS